MLYHHIVQENGKITGKSLKKFSKNLQRYFHFFLTWVPKHLIFVFRNPSSDMLKEGATFLTQRFHVFLQQQLHHNVSLCSIFRYSGPEMRISKPVLSCHRKWFASLFRVSAILPIHLSTSFQFWSKLLFFLIKVTYFVLAKQIWITYDQNSNFFLRRSSLWR